jgi:putative nucleotidyltransferase with HDIG domain
MLPRLNPSEAAARLAGMDPTPWNAAQPAIDALTRGGHEVFLVGGLVRDVLIGRPSGDPDLATSATPAEVMDLIPEAVPTGLKHGTVTVPAGGRNVEITTYRTEAPYSDARHPDRVVFVRSIAEDLARRDLTVNAMAYDPAHRRFEDPFGGLKDLSLGVLRAVGAPAARFKEDGLRPFRAIRLAVVLEFQIEPITLEAIGRSLPYAQRVAKERIRDELCKMLGGARPSMGFELMRQTGLLELVIPELLEGYGVTQNRYHAYDVYHHTLATVDAAPPRSLRVRLAALLHDVGKPRTRVEVEGQGTFYNHQAVGALMARDILTRLRFSGDMVESVTRLVECHMFHYEEEWTGAAVRRFIRRVGPELVPDLFELRRADSRGSGVERGDFDHLERLEERVKSELRRPRVFSPRDLALGGREVMDALGISPGPLVGKVLAVLVERVLEDPALNSREGLMGILQREFCDPGKISEKT